MRNCAYPRRPHSCMYIQLGNVMQRNELGRRGVRLRQAVKKEPYSNEGRRNMLCRDGSRSGEAWRSKQVSSFCRGVKLQRSFAGLERVIRQHSR